MSCRLWHFILACAVLLLGSSTADADWKKFIYRADGFEVEFSAEPAVSPTFTAAESAKAHLVRATDYLQDGGGYAYIVTATLVVDSVAFDNGVNAALGSYACKDTLIDRPLSQPGGKGREVKITGCDAPGRIIHARFYTKGRWFYHAAVIADANGIDDASVQRFLQSFKVH